MKATRRIFLSTLTALLLIPQLIFAQSKQNSPTIGFILLGNGIRDGALLAQQDIRSKGQAITLIFEDNRGDLATSSTIGSRLSKVEKVDAFVSIISGVANLLRPIATQAGIINIGICSEPEVADGKNSFINYLTAQQGVAKFIEHIAAGTSLGIYSLNESGFLRIVEELKREANSKLEIIYTETFDKETLDFRPVLMRRKSATPDALLILGLSPEIESLVRQARSLGIATAVTSIEGFGLANDKSPFEGAWFIDSAVPNSEFRARFLKTYGHEVTPGAGHSYDSVMLLAQAFASASTPTRSIDRTKALTAFRAIQDFRGTTGMLNVQPNGVIWSEASVKIIRNGKPELLGH